MSIEEKPLEGEPAPVFFSLKPAARILDCLIFALVALCALHIVMRTAFIAHMEGGQPPFTMPAGWIWLGTATDDLHIMTGLACLGVLALWLKKARRNIDALQIKGAVSEADVGQSILLLPNSFVFTYDRVLSDIWFLTATPPSGFGDNRRPSRWAPFVFWVAMMTLTIVHIVYYNLSARYYGTGSSTGQLFVSYVSLVLFMAVILTALLGRHIIVRITAGQEELYATPQQYRQSEGSVAAWSGSLRKYAGLLLIVFSSMIAGFFVTHYAPKIFVPMAEQQVRADISAVSRTHFLNDDFATLEKDIADYRGNLKKTPAGVMMLDYYYKGIEDGIAYTLSSPEEGMPELTRKITAWQQAYPSSAAAHLAQGLGYLIMGAYQPALGVMEKNKPLLATDPAYYYYMMKLAREMNWEKSRFMPLLDAAIASHPYYFSNYFAASDYFIGFPDRAASIEALAARAADVTSVRFGDSLYARVYWNVSQMMPNAQFLSDPRIWPRMKSGLQRVVSDHPDIWNVNAFARFACLAGDKETARPLMARIEGQASASAWWSSGSTDLYGSCVRWSMSE